MASSHTRHSLCHNSLPAGKDELVRGNPTKDSGTNTTTLIPAFYFAPTPASTPVLAVANIKELLQQMFKSNIESIKNLQEHGALNLGHLTGQKDASDRLLKAKNPNLSYENY